MHWRRESSVGRPPRFVRILNRLVPAAEPPTVDGPAARRRRSAVTAATIVVGTVLLAATWTIGAVISGPIPFQPDRAMSWRMFAGPVGVGVAAFMVFVAAYLVARHLPVFGSALNGVLATADASPTAVVLFVALVNGAGEELFFRGALHAALEPYRPAVSTTIVYVAVTAASGNVALVIAAAVMGSVLSLERLATRGVLAPMVTHVTWSTLMVLALPR